MQNSVSFSDVLIVGAGPVGLFAALRCAHLGYSVKVIEAEASLGKQSKASTFHPATLELLATVGIGEELKELGCVVDRIQWRQLDGTILAEASFSALAGETAFPYRLHAEQILLTPILLAKLLELQPGSVQFLTRFTGVTQMNDEVTVKAVTNGQPVAFKSRYVIGADGAHSAVRKELGIEFPGESYRSRAMRVVTRENLLEYFPTLSGITYVRDERQSCSLLQMRDHWRLIFRVLSDESDEEILDDTNVRKLVDKVVPGLSVDFAEIYSNRAHVASHYKAGRVVLVGDAAHVTSTAGGMNMNCGLHDAYAIAAAIDSCERVGSLDPLVEAAEWRRTVVNEFIIPRAERRAAGADGDEQSLEASLARLQLFSTDPERVHQFLWEASMFDTSPLKDKGKR